MRTLILFILILLTGSLPLMGDSYKDLNDRGVEAYKQQNYDSSLLYFEKAHDLNPDNDTVRFNMGGAFHQQGKYKEALETFGRAATSADSSMAAQAYYNIGNTYYRAGSLDSAAMAYMASLNYNPDDMDTKYNLELALKKIEEQQQQQQQQQQDSQDKQQNQDKKDQEDQQNKDQNQDQQNNPENQDQDKQDDQQGDKDKQDQQGQQDQDKKGDEKEQGQDQEQKEDQGQDEQEKNQDQQNQQDQQQSQPDENSESNGQGQAPQQMQLDKERAEALLEGLNDEEKEVLKQVIKKKAGVSSYNGKTW